MIRPPPKSTLPPPPPLFRSNYYPAPPRHKDRCRYLGMRMRPLRSRKRALIFEHADVLEARILFQIGDSRGPHPQDALDLFIAELRHPPVVLRRLHHHFMRADRAHLVVHAFA